jgi:uncharacterized 2Fe-2S/4Fe-4S cluster protein (DUF4445 family)
MSEQKGAMVIFQPSGRRGLIDKGKTIMEASIALGVDIEGICGEKATCGKCKIRIEAGVFEKYGIESGLDSISPIKEGDRKYLSNQQLQDRYRLACQTEILGDLVIFVPEESRIGKQVVRKAAGKITVDLKPAVRKYYVELSKATLDDTLGDFERITDELNDKFKLTNLTIDYQALLSLQNIVRKADWKVTISIWQNREIIKVEPGHIKKSYGLALDVGTTTVAGYLCDLTNGELVATESMMNPQVVYGEDVMSRICYTMTNPKGLEQLNQTIIKGINQLAGRAAVRAGIKRSAIVDMTIVGNTCMHHLILNLDPTFIGKAPFPPALHHSLDVKARDIGIKITPGAFIHVLPIEAGFVGADNVGVLISEAPHNQDKMELIIDIGTNGEIILGNRQRLISSSCATGPAFEGAEIKYGMRASPGAIEKIFIDPETKEVKYKVIDKEGWNTEEEEIGAKGICGSGIIDIVPQLFMAGIIDRTGRFKKEIDNKRYREVDGQSEYVIAWSKETSIKQDIVICQDDVRAIQLAKAAMYAGAKIMMRALSIDKVDKIILAGAFGSYIDKQSAALLGLFPDCDQKDVYAVGNAAGDGARIVLLNTDKRNEADKWARKVDYLELTVEEDFEKIFAKAMWLPHMKDKFPNIEHLLPKPEQKGG